MSYASVGMLYPVFAPLSSHTAGSMPNYGTGRVIQEARVATITKEFTENPLYGDDTIQDEDNGLTGLQVEFESTGLTDDDRIALFGEETNANTVIGGQWESDNATPYGGFGYIRKMREGGGQNGTSTTKYEAWLVLKIKFQETRQETRTKEGNQITWGTPQLTGRGAALDVDGGHQRFRLHKTFATIGNAKSWLNGLLNVSAVTT